MKTEDLGIESGSPMGPPPMDNYTRQVPCMLMISCRMKIVVKSLGLSK